jgi:hypothetical protein
VTFPDVHLADEAVAAYVDDGLSSSARQRAERHLTWCLECRGVVEAQREAKALLAAAPDPALPTGLLARLRDIPMTADLGGSDIVLVMGEQGLAWASLPADFSPPAGEAQLAAADEPLAADAAGSASALSASARSTSAGSGSAGSRSNGSGSNGSGSHGADSAGSGSSGSGPAGSGGSPGNAAPAAGSGRRPAQRGGEHRGARPRSYPTGLSARPMRRGRRRLAGALAGLAFGVIASAASTTAPNTAAPAGQVGGGGVPGPIVDRGGSSATTLELNTLRVGPDRRQSDLLPVSRRGR